MQGALRRYAEGGEVTPQQVLGARDVNGALMQMLLGRVQQRPPEESPETQAAYQAMQQQMMQPVDESSKWWKMASGLMAPTRTGSFTEATGAGAGAYGDALMQEEKQAAANRAAGAQLGIQRHTGLDKTRQANYKQDLSEMSDLAQRGMTLKNNKTSTNSSVVSTIINQARHAADNQVRHATETEDMTPAQRSAAYDAAFNHNVEQFYKVYATGLDDEGRAALESSMRSIRQMSSQPTIQGQPAVKAAGDVPTLNFLGMTREQVAKEVERLPNGLDKDTLRQQLSAGAPTDGTAAPVTTEGNVNPALQGRVTAILEGRDVLTPRERATPRGRKVLEAVIAADPNYDMVNYNARAATRKEATSGGRMSENIKSLSTAIGHLGRLSENFDRLGNSDYPMYNKIANALGNATGNRKIQADTAAVGTDSLAVAGEMAKVFRSVGMSQTEIQHWRDKISTDMPPAAMKAVIQEAADLMESRLHAIGNQYNQGMGTTKDELELLDPEARKTFEKIQNGDQKPAAKKMVYNPATGRLE